MEIYSTTINVTVKNIWLTFLWTRCSWWVDWTG